MNNVVEDTSWNYIRQRVLDTVCFTMGLAFAPRTWRTLRRKSLKLESIGKPFTAPSNPFSILCKEILVHAKVSMLIAALAW